MAQKKHSLCQARVSNATNLVDPKPPRPEFKETNCILEQNNNKKDEFSRNGFVTSLAEYLIKAIKGQLFFSETGAVLWQIGKKKFDTIDPNNAVC